jgi:cyclohexanecarboxylate-CoA ligase
MVGPPTFFVSMRDARKFRKSAVRSLRLISAGGTGVTPEMCQDLSWHFRALVKRSYGSTEAPTVATSHAGDPVERGWSTDGRTVGEAELRLAESGELEVRGPELFVGYGDASQTAAAMTDDGWFRTGDLATLDDGWLTVTGRLSDTIIRGGENISPAEVAAVLEAHRSVEHAVAVAMPDERLGERVCAFVVCRPGATFDLDTCRRWFERRTVARFKTPERVVVLREIPLLASGKPDRAALRERAGAPD